MSIYATLHVHPTCHPTHEMIYITRGASAELIFPLYDKVYSFADIEQITVTFKQGKTIDGINMFQTVIEEEKEVIKTDSHFYHFDNEDYSAIIFNLDNNETKSFKAGIPVEWEVAVKLNTDSMATLGNKDSIIIEPQHPIEVRDSLFSHVEEN